MENLANRIIEDIEVEFQSAVHIGEFDVIPAQDSQNRSPVVRIDGNLALEAWCVPTVYMHVYSLLMESRRLDGAKNASITAKEICSLSRILLLLNPDVITIWNMRKELLTSSESLDSLNEDFQLTELVLTRKPKNSEAFMHRRWLLGKLLKSGSTGICTQIAESCVRSELRVCTLAASRYPNNYVAWNHREWVHDTFTDYNLQILHDDLSWSKDWVAVNVSDHSGFQFRQYLLAKMVMAGNAQVDALLHEEKDTIRKLINYYPGHEALWYHYKLVTLLILKSQTLPQDEQCTPAKVPACEVVGDRSQQLMYSKCRTSLVEEMEYMDEFANSENSWQTELASRYKRWLSHTMQK